MLVGGVFSSVVTLRPDGTPMRTARRYGIDRLLALPDGRVAGIGSEADLEGSGPAFISVLGADDVWSVPVYGGQVTRFMAPSYVEAAVGDHGIVYFAGDDWVIATCAGGDELWTLRVPATGLDAVRVYPDGTLCMLDAMPDLDDEPFASELRQRFLAGEAPSLLLDALQRRHPSNVLGLLRAFGAIFALTLPDWRIHCDTLSISGQTLYYANRAAFDDQMAKRMHDAKSRWA